MAAHNMLCGEIRKASLLFSFNCAYPMNQYSEIKYEFCKFYFQNIRKKIISTYTRNSL